MLSMAVVVFAQRPSDLTRRRIMVDIRLDRERIPVATLHRLIRITMFREAPSIQHVFIIHDPPIGPRRSAFHNPYVSPGRYGGYYPYSGGYGHSGVSLRIGF